VVLWNQASIINGFRDIQWRMWRNGWHDLKRPLNKGQGLSCWYQSISHIRLPVNNNFCDSIRHIPFPTGVSLDSLELSFYCQPFLRYWALLSVLGVTTLTFQGHLKPLVALVIRFAAGHFILVVCWYQVSISNGFRDILPHTSCSHRHNAKSSLRMRDITWHITNSSTDFNLSPPVCLFTLRGVLIGTKSNEYF